MGHPSPKALTKEFLKPKFRVAKSNFLSLLKLLELRFGRKKHVNYVKFQTATNCINSQFHLNAFFFSLSAVNAENAQAFSTVLYVIEFGFIFSIPVDA